MYSICAVKKNMPCKGCAKRYVGCHSKCEDYGSWRAEQDELSATIRENRHSVESFDDYRFGQINKAQKRNKLGAYKR